MSNIEQLVIYIHWEDAHGQCYEECSAMTETKNGVAAQIKKLNEKCLLTHWYCHSINLNVGEE